jgi:peptidoglycan/LPS O-acetylase OafA/YrhL
MSLAAANPARTSTTFGYLPALDGLRALAIGAVIAQHSGIPRVSGYHGVTLFFVISGFLITSLLLRERASTGTIDLRRFYRRRFARLGPALVVVVVVTWGWLALTAQPLSSYWAGIVGSLTYTTDLMQAVTGNVAVGRYFQYSWSLGVEELFYLIWPAALLILVKWGSIRGAVVLLIAGIAGVWVLRTFLIVDGTTHDRYFFAPDTNADGLLLGALLAFVLVRFPNHRVLRTVGRVVGPIGLVALVALVLPHGPNLLAQVDSGAFGQTALASVALVFWMATSPSGWAARLFSWRPAVFIGKLSYGLYLWNLLTIFAFTSIVGWNPTHSPWGVVWAAVLFSLAYASWRFVETPLRRRWAPAPVGVSERTSVPASVESRERELTAVS